MSLKTPRARVQGLGSAKSGALHFWHQRATAVALVPLTKSGAKFWEVNVEGSRIAAEEAAKAKSDCRTAWLWKCRP